MFRWPDQMSEQSIEHRNKQGGFGSMRPIWGIFKAIAEPEIAWRV
jgi:hypothetical protein